MNGPSTERWEELVQQTARMFPYPPTPDVASRVASRLARRAVRPTTRRLAWALVLFIALLAGLLAVPPVRAAILEFLQIGAVRIWLVEDGPTPGIDPTLQGRREVGPSSLHPSFRLAGETTLAEAERSAGFQVRLPTYPPDLGAPDAVFYQELGGPVVVLVWLNPQKQGQARLSLHILGDSAFAHKGNPTVVLTTTVGGREAAWTQGPYVLAYQQGADVEYEMLQLVEGNVLIWSDGGLTYRLESDLTLEEAVRVAGSLE